MHIAQNFIPMLNNQYKQYRCYYFSRGSPCKVSTLRVCFGRIFWCRSLARASESSSPYQYFSDLHSGVWFMAKQLSVPAPTAALFFKVRLCVIKVTARKYLSGPLIKTEGEILITRQLQNKSAQRAESKAERISSQPWPPWNPWDPALSSQLTNSYCRLVICIFLNSGVLCVLFIFVQIENVTGKKK